MNWALVSESSLSPASAAVAAAAADAACYAKEDVGGVCLSGEIPSNRPDKNLASRSGGRIGCCKTASSASEACPVLQDTPLHSMDAWEKAVHINASVK